MQQLTDEAAIFTALSLLPAQAIPGSIRSYCYLGQEIQVLLPPEATGNRVGVLLLQEKKGCEPPAHIHTREDEVFIIQKGEMCFYVQGKEYNCREGDVMFLPKNVEHRFEVKSDDCQVLNVLMPGHFVNFFIEMATPAPGTAKPPDSGTMAALKDRLIATALRYGIVFPNLPT
jgi:quercetin dioxygenase-like cupin family protein